jgi:hypothetical protein
MSGRKATPHRAHMASETVRDGIHAFSRDRKCHDSRWIPSSFPINSLDEAGALGTIRLLGHSQDRHRRNVEWGGYGRVCCDLDARRRRKSLQAICTLHVSLIITVGIIDDIEVYVIQFIHKTENPRRIRAACRYTDHALSAEEERARRIGGSK